MTKLLNTPHCWEVRGDLTITVINPSCLLGLSLPRGVVARCNILRIKRGRVKHPFMAKELSLFSEDQADPFFRLSLNWVQSVVDDSGHLIFGL